MLHKALMFGYVSHEQGHQIVRISLYREPSSFGTTDPGANRFICSSCCKGRVQTDLIPFVTSSLMNCRMKLWSLGAMLMNLSPMPGSLNGPSPNRWL